MNCARPSFGPGQMTAQNVIRALTWPVRFPPQSQSPAQGILPKRPIGAGVFAGFTPMVHGLPIFQPGVPGQTNAVGSAHMSRVGLLRLPLPTRSGCPPVLPVPEGSPVLKVGDIIAPLCTRNDE